VAGQRQQLRGGCQGAVVAGQGQAGRRWGEAQSWWLQGRSSEVQRDEAQGNCGAGAGADAGFERRSTPADEINRQLAVRSEQAGRLVCHVVKHEVGRLLAAAEKRGAAGVLFGNGGFSESSGGIQRSGSSQQIDRYRRSARQPKTVCKV
jgi:hypothetical protein